MHALIVTASVISMVPLRYSAWLHDACMGRMRKMLFIQFYFNTSLCVVHSGVHRPIERLLPVWRWENNVSLSVSHPRLNRLRSAGLQCSVLVQGVSASTGSYPLSYSGVYIGMES